MVTNRPQGREEPTQQQDVGGRFAQQARKEGGRIGQRLRETGSNIVDEQKNRACEELESLGEVVHETAGRLHERDDHLVADYVDALADRIEEAAEFVRDHSAGDLIESVNNFARRRPEIFIGAALLAGIAAARFLKASRPGSPSSEPFRGGARPTGGGFETRTSEAGPFPTSPRTSQKPGVGPGGGPERLNPRVSDRPQGFARPAQTPRGISQDEAQQSGAGTEGLYGSHLGPDDRDEPIGGREPREPRESRGPRSPEDNR